MIVRSAEFLSYLSRLFTYQTNMFRYIFYLYTGRSTKLHILLYFRIRIIKKKRGGRIARLQAMIFFFYCFTLKKTCGDPRKKKIFGHKVNCILIIINLIVNEVSALHQKMFMYHVAFSLTSFLIVTDSM